MIKRGRDFLLPEQELLLASCCSLELGAGELLCFRSRLGTLSCYLCQLRQVFSVGVIETCELQLDRSCHVWSICSASLSSHQGVSEAELSEKRPATCYIQH